MKTYTAAELAELARDYMLTSQPAGHPFIKQLHKDPTVKMLLAELGQQDHAVQKLYPTLARAFAVRYLVKLTIPYRTRLTKAKELAEKLRVALRGGELFPYENEQILLDIALSRLQQLKLSRPTPGAIMNDGSGAAQRAMRDNIQVDLQARGLKLTGAQYATLCTIVDPEIDAGTCRRERKVFALPANIESLENLQVSLDAYIAAIVADENPQDVTH